MCEWAEMDDKWLHNKLSVHLASIGQFLVTPVFGTDGQLPLVLWKLTQAQIRGGPKVLTITGF